jgi:hypothetical protein
VESLGPAAFWHLLKADQYIAFATGEKELEDFEWSPGNPGVAGAGEASVTV